MFVSENHTPFRAEMAPYTDPRGRKWAVVVVKATFHVRSDGRCVPAHQQDPFAYADQHYGAPEATAIRYESEFAPFKPRVDVLLNAAAVAPRERPTAEMRVAFGGPWGWKHACILGDRHWERGVFGVTPSDPEPFTSMPLVWDRSFGGSDDSYADAAHATCDMRNPVGRGFHTNRGRGSMIGRPLPNIERPEHRIRRWSDRPVPLGFGVCGRTFAHRIHHAGTYDQDWMDHKLPLLPDDFDVQYFQGAPRDQQLEQLAVGTRFECVHMTASGTFRVTTPALRVPVGFHFDTQISEARLTPDTVIVEPARSTLILLGRVKTPLPRKFMRLREIRVGHAPARRGKVRTTWSM